MHTVTFTIGVGERANGTAIADSSRKAMTDFAERVLVRTYGGYTRRDVSGGWVDPRSGTLVREPAIEYVAHCEAKQDYRATACELRAIFEQHTVVLTVARTDVRFIDENA